MATANKKPLARLLDLLVQKANEVTYLLLLIGIVGFAVLPGLQRRNNFDENALLAGSAHPTIRSRSPWALQNAGHFASSYKLVHSTPTSTTWVKQLLQRLGLDAYTHTYSSINHPATQPLESCTNVHGILRAHRGDAKESILLVTPLQYSAGNADFQQSSDAAAFALSLGYAVLAHLSNVPWLAKDVIWVIPDASCGLVASMDAWVQTYQSLASSAQNESFGRAGVLQQAIVLEVPTADFNAIELSVEGYDGQLPKLDMYWLLKYYSSTWTSLPVMLRGQAAAQKLGEMFRDTPAVQEYVSSLATLAQFVWRQARGLPMGAHAAFKEVNVDAVTVRLIHQDDLPIRRVNPSIILPQLADVLELSLRSCNILIEKFHHSLFLYLQSSPEHHVSIDMYIIAPVALLACLLLQAAATKRVHDVAGAGAGEGGWVQSIRQVLMVQVGCAVVGLAVRQLLQQGGAGAGLAGVVQQGGVLSVKSVTAGGCAAVVVAAALSGSTSSSSDEQRGVAGRAAQLRSRVVLLSVAAAVLSAVVCLNWALAYMCLLMVAPLAVLTSTSAVCEPQAEADAQQGQMQTRRVAAERGRVAWLRWVACAVFSPMVVAVLLLALSGSGQLGLQDVIGMVRASRLLTYMLFWGMFVPFWWLCTFAS